MDKEKREYTVSFDIRATDVESVALDSVALPSLVALAFSEFVANRCRGDAEQYVDERYPHSECRACKVKQIERRNQVARMFCFGGLCGVTVRLREE